MTLVVWLAAWLTEHAGRIAATIGLRALGQWLLRKTLALRGRQPPKAFVTPEEFFSPYLNRPAKTLIRHDLKIVERDQDVATLMKEILDLKWPVVVVTGAPGQGKSRFALELARSIGTDRRTVWQRLSFRGQRWKTFFVKSGMADVLSQVGTLPRRHPVALFVDDAANNPQLAGALAEYASASNDAQPLVLIFTSRAYLLPTFLDALPLAFMGRTRKLQLKRLSVDGIGKIFDELAPGLSRANRNRFIQLTKDSPFLTVLLCDALRSGVPLAAQLSDEQLRRKLCDEPLEKATSNCGIALSKVLVALAAISAAAPYERHNEKLRGVVKNLSGLNDVEFDCILQAALDSGLFIEYGPAKVRPAPDLVGDLILDRALISDAGDMPTTIAERIVAELLPIIPERVLNNVADLGWTRGATQVDLIGPILHSYKEQATLLSASDLYGLLERLRPISVRRADAVLDIIEALWWRICHTEPICEDSAREWRRLLAVAMPVLEGASYAEDGLVRSMVLVKNIYQNAAVETGYDNHKPLNVLIEIAGFSPFRSLDLTATAMTELERWFEQGGSDAVVALEALDRVLSGTVNWTESGAASVTFSSQVLNLSGEVVAIRDRAVQLVERGILSDDPKLTEQALATVDALGRYRGSPGYAPDSPMALQIGSEKLRLLNAMERTLAEGRMNRVMRRIEKCLWHWWCFADERVANRSADLLRLIPSDPAYQISKGLFDSDVPLETHVPSPETIGEMSRHEYFFKEGHDKFAVVNVEPVLSRLGLNDTVDQWAAFLRSVSVDEGPTAWHAKTIFEAIARRAPAAAIKLVTDYENEPWSNNNSALLSTVRIVDQELWRAGLNTALGNTDLSEHLAFAWLCSLDWENQFDEIQAAFVDMGIATHSARLTSLIVDNMVYRVAFPWEDSIRKLFQIAETVAEDEHVLDQIYSKLARNRGGSSVGIAIADVDKQALRYLLRVQTDDGVPWDKPYWVGAYLEFIAKNYPVEFLGFLRESLSQLPQSSSMHLEILGARNAEGPINALLNGPLRQAHLTALFEMASEENVSGVFVRAVLRSVLPVTDPDFQQRIEKALAKSEATKAAAVLSGYNFSLDWLELCRKTLDKSEALGLDHFEQAAIKLEGPFWTGSRSRSIGKPSERDSQISFACAELSKDGTLPPRTRDFFRRRREYADNSIEHDLKSDEDLLGDRLLQ
ncbi:MAG: ATP-binding protein [Thiobacillus sp.]|nr:ATP-binding protein [Thiobacillus sp.]MDP2979632.1 ATP-binding protein [Thiobacillus sp.]